MDELTNYKVPLPILDTDVTYFNKNVKNHKMTNICNSVVYILVTTEICGQP